MNLSKIIVILLIATTLFSSCNKNRVTIKGKIEHQKNNKIFFSELLLSKEKIVDSAILSKKGQFKFVAKISQPAFYQIRFSSTKVVTLLLKPGEHVNIDIDAYPKMRYNINGSDGSILVKELADHLANSQQSLDSLFEAYNALSKKLGFDTITNHIQKDYQDVLYKQRRFMIGFLLNHMTSLSSIVALYQKYNDGNYVLNDNHDLQFIKLVSDSLNKYYPESPYVKALWAERERLLRQADQLRITSLIDKKAITSFPDIELPNPNGKMIHLNSIKEKCIILNFWSPEDKYCTQVTMGLKSVFDQYKSNKIEIYNIALTANENVWKECIKTLDFPGIQVIDKSQDPLCAKTYNVTALPSSFLIDKQGNIVARDLYGDKLKERIKQILQ